MLGHAVLVGSNLPRVEPPVAQNDRPILQVGRQGLQVVVFAPVVVEVEALDTNQAVKGHPFPQVTGLVPVDRADRQVRLSWFPIRSHPQTDRSIPERKCAQPHQALRAGHAAPGGIPEAESTLCGSRLDYGLRRSGRPREVDPVIRRGRVASWSVLLSALVVVALTAGAQANHSSLNVLSQGTIARHRSLRLLLPGRGFLSSTASTPSSRPTRSSSCPTRTTPSTCTSASGAPRRANRSGRPEATATRPTSSSTPPPMTARTSSSRPTRSWSRATTTTSSTSTTALTEPRPTSPTERADWRRRLRRLLQRHLHGRHQGFFTTAESLVTATPTTGRRPGL